MEEKMNLKSRKEKIKSLLPFKYFYEDSFDKNGIRNVILSDLKLKGINESGIFTCGTILKKDQEYHLFRKYNYLKYRLFKLTNLKIDMLSERSVDRIESVIEKMQQTRNIILKCNTRLVVKPATVCFEKDSFNGEEFISNGFMHVIKAIECFDYRRGIKFSTYAVWALKNNLSRDRKNMLEKRVLFYENFREEGEEKFEPPDQRKEDYREANSEYNVLFLKDTLKSFGEESDKNNMGVEILRKLYGLNGNKPSTLVDVAKSINVSKARVGQLRDEMLGLLRKRARNGDYTYDPIV